MKIKTIIGHVFGILGLLILAWNAYVYLSGKRLNKISSGAGLFFCFFGAVMIRGTKNTT